MSSWDNKPEMGFEEVLVSLIARLKALLAGPILWTQELRTHKTFIYLVPAQFQRMLDPL